MNILVTGANGFLGSNLIDSLSKQNHNIYALSINDNNLKKFNNIKFDSMKLNNIALLKNKILAFKPEVVIHCAWIGANAYKDINDIRQFDNVKYSLDLLQILKEINNLYFVCIGSMAEYGIKDFKVSEEELEDPRSMYGVSKYMLKLYSKIICEKNNFKWLWIRPSYVYGENDVETRLIPRVITKCLKNENLVLNSCDSVVDYIYIKDFVDGVCELIYTSSEGVYNICSGEQYCIKDIVTIIHKISNTKSSIFFDSSLDREGFSKYICGVNTKIIKKTNWLPQTKINQGLIRTTNFLRGEINGCR